MFNLPVTAFLQLLIGFGFLIFVHELGHFLVAKAVGIKCTQFAIGFGQSVVAWRKGIGFRAGSTEREYEKRVESWLKEHGGHPTDGKQHVQVDEMVRTERDEEGPHFEGADIDRANEALGLGETEYRLNWVPLGGYVKMLGQEDLDPGARSNDPRSYNSKAIWARACVISAGVVMNLIFGLLLFIVAFMAGVKFPPSVVGNVVAGSPAAETYAIGHEDDPAFQGLEIGDRIVSVDGDRVDDMLDVRMATALSSEGSKLTFLVNRPGIDQPLTFELLPEPDPVQKLLSVGIMPSFELRLDAILQDSDVYAAGVRPGWTITAVDGQPVSTYTQFHKLRAAAEEKPFTITFSPPTEPRKQTEGEADAPVTAPFHNSPVVQVTKSKVPHLLGLAIPTEISPAGGEGTPASKAGVVAGDIVLKLDDLQSPSIDAIRTHIKDAHERDQPVRMTVYRDGKAVDLGEIKPDSNGVIGIQLSAATEGSLIAGVVPDGPFAQADIPEGSRLVSVNGEPVSSLRDAFIVLRGLATSDETPSEIELTVELPVTDAPKETLTAAISSEAWETIAAARWTIDVPFGLVALREPVKAETPVAAAMLGVKKTNQYIIQTYQTLMRLFEGSVKPEHLRGPVGIVHEGTRVAEEGWPYLMFFLGLISVNLAVINFLPIPVVDGGHIVFLIIEKVKGSPPSPRVQTIATIAGLALIGLVFIVVTYNDIYRLVATT